MTNSASPRQQNEYEQQPEHPQAMCNDAAASSLIRAEAAGEAGTIEGGVGGTLRSAPKRTLALPRGEPTGPLSIRPLAGHRVSVGGNAPDRGLALRLGQLPVDPAHIVHHRSQASLPTPHAADVGRRRRERAQRRRRS